MVCWDICFFLELGEGMESYNIQNGGQVVPQRKIRVLLSEEERKGILGRQKMTHVHHITSALLFYFWLLKSVKKMDHFIIIIL